MDKKHILFLTGTRADYGKLKSLIALCELSDVLEVHVFVTGMHMKNLYGYTVDEIVKSGHRNIFKFINHDDISHMDRTLAKTIDGLSHYIADCPVDLIVVHGDRVETLAGAIVGSLNNILVAHVEGGEVSGTIDELIRHAVTKLSHIHLASNEEAKRRLTQLGEYEESIYVIGSPDLDLMFSDELPPLSKVMNHYDIEFNDFAIAMYHPVTTEPELAEQNAVSFVEALEQSQRNYIVIYPNNDLGSNVILKAYERLTSNNNFRVFPSIRFENFLVLLKNAQFIVGNSSAAVREAPYFNVPSINIGSRQNNRASAESIINCGHDVASILKSINQVGLIEFPHRSDFNEFGVGNSAEAFMEILSHDDFWNRSKQKQLQDL